MVRDLFHCSHEREVCNLLIVAGSQNNTCCVDILCEGQLHITWYV